MFTRDIHSNKETIIQVEYELDNSIFLAKKAKEKILCLIIGYGSHKTSHKINTFVLERLEEYKRLGKIKDYILGSKLDIFDLDYQKFKNKELIPEEEKRKKNPGAVYISL